MIEYSRSTVATSLPDFPVTYGTDYGSFTYDNPTHTSGEGIWTLHSLSLGFVHGTPHGPSSAQNMHARSRITCGGASGATFPNDTQHQACLGQRVLVVGCHRMRGQDT